MEELSTYGTGEDGGDAAMGVSSQLRSSGRVLERPGLIVCSIVVHRVGYDHKSEHELWEWFPWQLRRQQTSDAQEDDGVRRDYQGERLI
jgi:hypothetical protein